MRPIRLVAIAALSCTAMPLLAQATPDKPVAAARSERAAGVQYLIDTYKISESEANQRIALEDQVARFAQSLKAQSPDDFGGIWIQHAPTYKIIVGLKSATDAKDFRGNVSPAMRQFLQTRRVKHSETELVALIDQVVEALRPLGLSYASYYEHTNDSLIIDTQTDANVGKIRQALPQGLQSFVQVRKGAVPTRSQASGYMSGDGVYGGWWFSENTNDATKYSCSFAFNAKDNLNRPVILTAAHCPDTPKIYYQANGTPRWVSLTFEKQWIGQGTKYDYQWHRTDGLANGAWVWFDNSNSKINFQGFKSGDNYPADSSKNIVSGQPDTGYYAVRGTWGYYDQKVGQVMCKSGHSSGLTCGQITHGYYTYNGAKGWIETGLSSAYIYAVSGDSGGAVFTSPDSAGAIKAAGIVTAATIHDPTRNAAGEVNFSGDEMPCLPYMEGNASYSDVGADCKMIHMPIDYVDDQQLITVSTQ